MKTLSILILLISASTASAALNCLDLRATTFTPCDPGEERMYVQGSCQKSYQVESTYCAVEGNPECKDARVAHFSPCEDGEKRIFIQGQCTRRYQVEHTYCAKR